MCNPPERRITIVVIDGYLLVMSRFQDLGVKHCAIKSNGGMFFRACEDLFYFILFF